MFDYLIIAVDINNVGSISQALFAKDDPDYDEAVAARWQAAQVSAISITNFIGRILIGPDFFLLFLYATFNHKLAPDYIDRNDIRLRQEPSSSAKIILHLSCCSFVRRFAAHGCCDR